MLGLALTLILDADIVCARSRNHYDPNSDLNFSESATHVSGQAGQSLEEFRSGFLPTKPNQAERMYFMVRVTSSPNARRNV